MNLCQTSLLRGSYGSLSRMEKKYIALLSLILGVFAFVCSLEGVKDSFKLISHEWIGSLLSLIESRKAPLTGLALGVLITSTVHSSSAVVATAMVSMAGLVASGLPLSTAVSFGVPLVMGANIGTTVTCIMATLGVKKGMTEEEFNASIPGAIIDDVVKSLNVGLFFVLEVTTGFLSKIITWLMSFLTGVFELEAFFAMFEKSIVDILIKGPITEPISKIFSDFLGFGAGGTILLVLWFLGIILALYVLERGIQTLIRLPKFEKVIFAAFKSPIKSFAAGLGLTFIVGSSSVTTSLMIPLLATRMVSLEEVYPYVLGTALGTTIDLSQIYGYVAGGMIGMSLGLAHVLLNVFGLIIWLLLPLRVVPITIAGKIGAFIASHNRSYLYLIGFVIMLFYIIPLTIIFLL